MTEQILYEGTSEIYGHAGSASAFPTAASESVQNLGYVDQGGYAADPPSRRRGEGLIARLVENRGDRQVERARELQERIASSENEALVERITNGFAEYLKVCGTSSWAGEGYDITHKDRRDAAIAFFRQELSRAVNHA